MKEEILTLKEALAKAVDKLQQMEVPDADIDAWYLLSYVTGLDRAAFFLHGEEPMAEPDMIRYRDLVTKRGERIPLQHLTGEQEFMGLDFHVNEPCTDPETGYRMSCRTGSAICRWQTSVRCVYRFRVYCDSDCQTW